MNDTHKTIKIVSKLQKNINSPFPILSIYLNFKNREQEKNPVDMFYKLLNGVLTNSEEDLLEGDILEIASYLKKYETHNLRNNIVIFSGGNKIWEVINHDFEIPSQCKISYSPFVAPLITAIRNQNRYLIILADRKKAFFFTLINNVVEDFQEFRDPIVPQKVKAIKDFMGRDTHISRHIENHLRRHLIRISHHVDTFAKNKHIQAVLVGGHKTLLHKIEKFLSKPLQERLIGEFVTELNIPKNDLVNHSKTAIAKASMF